MTMPLYEILEQLPPGTVAHLNQLLASSSISIEPTKEEVLSTVEQLIIEVKRGGIGVLFETDDRAIELLNQVPQAVVDQLFA